MKNIHFLKYMNTLAQHKEYGKNTGNHTKKKLENQRENTVDPIRQQMKEGPTVCPT